MMSCSSSVFLHLPWKTPFVLLFPALTGAQLCRRIPFMYLRVVCVEQEFYCFDDSLLGYRGEEAREVLVDENSVTGVGHC